MSTLAEKASRAYWLGQQIKALEEERNALLDAMQISETGDYAAGDFIVKVYPTVRFDPATAKRALTPQEFESILATKPDSAKAKAVLGGERYAATQKVYGMTRKIIPITDEEDV